MQNWLARKIEYSSLEFDNDAKYLELPSNTDAMNFHLAEIDAIHDQLVVFLHQNLIEKKITTKMFQFSIQEKKGKKTEILPNAGNNC